VGQIQETGAALWQRETGKQDQRESDQQVEMRILGLDESLYYDLRREIATIRDSPSRDREGPQ
jgi:hypothetical protein